MKLYITDKGDPSVGILQTGWEVECPFEQKTMDQEGLEFFKNAIVNVYKEFAEGKVVAEYDFESKNKDF